MPKEMVSFMFIAVEFNCQKTLHIALVLKFTAKLLSVNLGSNSINWCKSINYLWMHSMSDKHISTACDVFTCKLYVAYNCVFVNCSNSGEVVYINIYIYIYNIQLQLLGG